MVNYTLGDDIKKLAEFEVRSATGEICITSELDYEKRISYEFPVIATDRGECARNVKIVFSNKTNCTFCLYLLINFIFLLSPIGGLSTIARIKVQLTDVNDNRPVFYPRKYNVSLRETASASAATAPIVAVVATDADAGRFGAVTYRIVAGNEAGIFRIDRANGEIFINRPNMLSVRTQPVHVLNISASDGGGMRSSSDALVFLSIIDATQRPPIFEKPRYSYHVKEDVPGGTVVGSVMATSSNAGKFLRAWV